MKLPTTAANQVGDSTNIKQQCKKMDDKTISTKPFGYQWQMHSDHENLRKASI